MAIFEINGVSPDAAHQIGQELQAVSNNWQAWLDEVMSKMELHLVLWFEPKRKREEPSSAKPRV